MEPVAHLSDTVQGVEVLFFKDAEVTKVKGDQKSFATFGILSVLYFQAYNRFVLQINDWRYPLLRRLTISSNGNGSYMLPAMNGFSYNLKINAGSGQALANFDNLLVGMKGLEKSPEDSLVRRKGPQKEIGTREVITETINHIFHKAYNKASTFKTETKYLTSKKKRVDLQVIKNKDFKKEAQSKIKKNYLESREKVSNEFLTRRKNNFNQVEPRDIETLRKTTGYDAAVMHLPKEDIEETILKGKDIFYAVSGTIDPSMHPEAKKGFMESLKEGLHHMKDNLKRDTRHGHTENVTEKNVVSVEGLTHYQG